jgi:hypothetical protein
MNDVLADPEAPETSVTVTVTANVPVAVGAPEMTPVLGLTERPPGRPVADHVNGAVPPFVVSVEE